MSLVDGDFNGAFGGDGDEDFVIGKGGSLSGSHGGRERVKRNVVKIDEEHAEDLTVEDFVLMRIEGFHVWVNIGWVSKDLTDFISQQIKKTSGGRSACT
uniref:Uncharacterized protein n=1 Tax=Tanacetum cinerariifolium TaxID=118510 RepID=A0A6L2K7C1_TANCI|nr:hypothetical protein [Tanacetum cinerariifolium]